MKVELENGYQYVDKPWRQVVGLLRNQEIEVLSAYAGHAGNEDHVHLDWLIGPNEIPLIAVLGNILSAPNDLHLQWLIYGIAHDEGWGWTLSAEPPVTGVWRKEDLQDVDHDIDLIAQELIAGFHDFARLKRKLAELKRSRVKA